MKALGADASRSPNPGRAAFRTGSRTSLSCSHRRADQRVVAKVVRVAGEAVHGGHGNVEHLASRHVVQDEGPAVVVPTQGSVHFASGLSEQRRGLRLRSAMGVDLDEDPFGPALEVDALRDPRIDTASRSRISGGYGGALDAKAAAFAPRESERPLNHQNS